MNKKKFSFSIPSLSVGLHRFGAMRLPGISRLRVPLPGGVYLGGGKLILVSLSAVALGFLSSMFLLISTGAQEIVWPNPGAVYEAPSFIGAARVDTEQPEIQSQTLQLNLPAGIRLDTVSFKNVSLGKAGLTNAFEISGTSTAYIIIDEMIITGGSEFPTMDFANGEIYEFNATSTVEAAGHTVNITMSTSTSAYTIGSTRGAAQYEAEDMVVDRVILKFSSTGDDILIRRLIIDGVKASTGAFDMDYVKIGKLTMSDLKVGDDGDINSADLVVNSSVSITDLSDGIVDKPIFIR
jgi:hypothetical protein